ncbi:hypothetical protein GMJAKD_08340 [Candidatus Electrothrix aarhusensis]
MKGHPVADSAEFLCEFFIDRIKGLACLCCWQNDLYILGREQDGAHQVGIICFVAVPADFADLVSKLLQKDFSAAPDPAEAAKAVEALVFFNFLVSYLL